MRFWINALATSWAVILSCLPRKALWVFACGLAFLWFDLFRIRRWTVLKNLSIAFPEKSHDERVRLGRESMRYTCYNFFEFSLLPTFDQKWVDENVIFHGLEQFEKAKAQGKGVLLLSMHVGNGDVGVAALALKGLRLNLISKKFKNQAINQFWFGVRERMGTRFFEAHGRNLAFDILKACRNNEGVVFVIDQFMGKPYGIESTFFGRKTGTAYGLALFALKTEAPVLPVYTYRDEDLKTHVVFEEPVNTEIVTENKQDKDLQIKRMTQKYNDRVENIVREHPEQWMWIHRRWKKWE